MAQIPNKDDKLISNLIKQGGGNIHPGENVEYKLENDPLFKPINDEKKKKIDEAVERKIKSLTLDENVDTDNTTVPGQNYALITIVAPSGHQKHDSVCLKIKGVFDKIEEARKQAEILQKMDDTFDIYVVELYKWLLVPPDPEMLEQVHVDQKLNEILSGHREDQLKSKMYFEERKRELMENIDLENETRKEQNEIDLKNNISEDAIPDKNPTIKIETIENKDVDESGISASNQNYVQNEILGNCPNSAEISTPTEIMDNMVKSEVVTNPSNKLG